MVSCLSMRGVLFFSTDTFQCINCCVRTHCSHSTKNVPTHCECLSLGKKNTDRYLSPLHPVGSALVSLRVMVGIRFTSILHSSQPALPLRMQFSHFFFFRIYSTEIRKWLDEKKKGKRAEEKKTFRRIGWRHSNK